MIVCGNFSSAGGRFLQDTFCAGTTSKVPQFPLYARDSSVKVGEFSYLYHKPEAGDIRQSRPVKYDAFLGQLTAGISRAVFALTAAAEETNIVTCLKGFIADTRNRPLLVLTTSTKHCFQYSQETGEEELLTDKLRLYVSTEFMSNPIYKNLYKKVYTEYIQECFEAGVEVVFTTSDIIDNLMYQTEFELDYKNLTELSQHLSDPDIGNALFFDVDAALEEIENPQEPEPEFEEIGDDPPF
jgi:hypothetical protein